MPTFETPLAGTVQIEYEQNGMVEPHTITPITGTFYLERWPGHPLLGQWVFDALNEKGERRTWALAQVKSWRQAK